jgi:hypothetical protein
MTGGTTPSEAGSPPIIVDNSQGADPAFVQDLRSALSATGFEVEVRDPSPGAMFDTSVHFVVEAVSIRVPDGLAAADLDRVAAAVRDAEARRGNPRRRVRAVPIYRAETRVVLRWVDVFE